MKPLLFALATFLSTPSFALDCPTNKDGILFVIQRYETKIGPFSSSFDAINTPSTFTEWTQTGMFTKLIHQDHF